MTATRDGGLTAGGPYDRPVPVFLLASIGDDGDLIVGAVAIIIGLWLLLKVASFLVRIAMILLVAVGIYVLVA